MFSHLWVTLSDSEFQGPLDRGQEVLELIHEPPQGPGGTKFCVPMS